MESEVGLWRKLYAKITTRRYSENLYKQSLDEIRYKAITGRYVVRGFGYSGRLPHFDDLLLVPAHLAPPTPLDSYREKADVTVSIGKGMVEKPVFLNTPIMIGAMSYGATSREFKLACAKAANETGTASNTGEGGMMTTRLPDGTVEWTEYEYTKPNGYLVVQFASGRWGVSVDYLLHSDMIEVKFGQGAKPGMEGHLLAEKVTKKIAETRGMPEGTDCLSPARHLDIRCLDD